MGRTLLHTLVSAALAALAAGSALAQDAPGVVGRISSVQGQVTLVNDGDEPAAAMLNWPVTSANHINTARGARTEFRIGSTAVRVDGDSDVEVTELDDDSLRLRVNYGSVSVRIRNPDALRDFELVTPQARVTLNQPGAVRVDVERTPDTSQVSVLSGNARVDGAGSAINLAVGRRADVGNEDVRTSVARRDAFDAWAEERDRRADAAAANTASYIPTDITGYEELDQSGSWSDNVEYGTLWTPRNVADDWAPYRDGQWTWLAPWGWTWIDNAPWGYAPSHYGRWVMVDRRWRWAPGRSVGRPVWAPALVGWVGGDQFSVGRDGRRAPGLGWFPLSPRERYVPGYRVSPDHERRLGWSQNGKTFAPNRDEPRGYHDGVTVLPRAQFEGRHVVPVKRGPDVILQPNQVRNMPLVAAPAPAGPPRGRDVRVDRNDRNERNDRNDRNERNERNDRNERNERNERNDRGGPGNAQFNSLTNNGQQQNGQQNGQPGRVITAPSRPQYQQPGQQPQLQQPQQGQQPSQQQQPWQQRPQQPQVQPQQPQPQVGQPQGQQPQQPQRPQQPITTQLPNQNNAQQPVRSGDPRRDDRPGQVSGATPAMPQAADGRGDRNDRNDHGDRNNGNNGYDRNNGNGRNNGNDRNNDNDGRRQFRQQEGDQAMRPVPAQQGQAAMPSRQQVPQPQPQGQPQQPQPQPQQQPQPQPTRQVPPVQPQPQQQQQQPRAVPQPQPQPAQQDPGRAAGEQQRREAAEKRSREEREKGERNNQNQNNR